MGEAVAFAEDEAIEHVSNVRALSGHRLELRFDDGTEGIVDLSDRLFGPEFAPLQNPQLFAEARIDEFGAISWPNGADLAQDEFYERIRRIEASESRE
jgi:hypothetical protein